MELTSSNNNHKDLILTRLTDMFGGVISFTDIFAVCVDNDWQFDSCVEGLIKLIQETEELKAEGHPSTFVPKPFDSNDQVSGNHAPDLFLDSYLSSRNIQLHETNESSGAIPKSTKPPTRNSSTHLKQPKLRPHEFQLLSSATKSGGQKNTSPYHAHPELSNLESVLNTIRSGFKIIVLMRGAPGSGKSHLARKIIDDTVKGDCRNHIFSTDDYFYKAGKFIFEPDKLPIAHENNQRMVRKRADAGWSPIIVDNTNIKIFEMLPYVDTAVKFGYIIEIVESGTSWSRNAEKLVYKTLHDVPKASIQKMLNNFERTSPQELVKLNGIPYRMQLPQLRLKPHIRISRNKKTNASNPTNRRDLTQNDSDTQSAINKNGKTAHVDDFLEKLYDLNVKNVEETLRKSNKSKKESKECWKNQLKNESAYSLCSKNVPKPQRVQNKTAEVDLISRKDINELEKTEVESENKSEFFTVLLQIFPKKELHELWHLFEKYEGNVNLAIEELIKDDSCYDKSTNLVELRIDASECKTNDYLESSNPEMTNEYNNEVFKLLQPEIKCNNLNRLSHEINENQRAEELQCVLKANHYRDQLRNNNEQSKTNGSVPLDSLEDDHELSDAETEDMIEITLGSMLTDQLANIFKFDLTSKHLIKDLKTDISIPKSLANQLYLLWVESICNQIEEIRHKSIQEDEELSQLSATQPKNNNCSGSKSFCTSMLSRLCNLEHDQASNSTKFNPYNTFYNVINKKALEQLEAHENKLSDTLNDPKNSAIKERNSVIDDDEKTQQITQENETVDFGSVDTEKLTSEKTKRMALHYFENSRNLAVHYSQLKGESYFKAKEAMKNGNTAVAAYYAQIANLHKNKIDMYNHTAANYILAVHDLTQNNPEFLDLHYLHVVEAEQCFDIFIDEHITKLRDGCINCKYVFIITGRGLHSTGGIATVKNKVKLRLKERHLKWSEVNPGLLKVKLFATSKYAKLCS